MDIDITGIDLIDTHCHLSALRDLNPEQAISNAAALGVRRLLCVGSVENIKSAFDAVALAEKYTNVWAAIGIHPHDAAQYTSLEAIRHLAAHPRVVAIGETGLDYFRDWSPRVNQLALFVDTIAAAKEYRKPLIIHCREALNETLAVLQKENAAEVGGVFHCYSGDAEFAAQLQRINFLVSFPGTITFRKAVQPQEAASKIPLEQIMVETDCPYMAPEPFRGKPSEPAHTYYTAKKLADLRKLPFADVARATTQNAERLFKFARP